MARQTVLVCDFGANSCSRPAKTYRIWIDGERQATAVDLCDLHAEPVLAVLRFGEQSDLPSKPRVKMEATRLKTTEATRHLKQ